MGADIDATSSGKARPPGIGSRIGATLIVLPFVGIGVWFLGLIGREVIRAVAMDRWVSVPCIIESSVAGNGRDEYYFHVRYRYEFGGKQWHSEQFRPGTTSATSSQYRAMQRLADAYPVGATAHCYVNPANPAQAVFQGPERSGTLFILLLSPIPLAFATIGGFCTFAIWFLRPKAGETPAETQVGAPPPKSRHTRIGFALAFGGFILLGGAGLYFLVVRVGLDVRATRGWTVTPCVIESSRVRSQIADSGRMSNRHVSYSTDILYRYQVNGRVYRSSQYDFQFLGGSSGSFKANASFAHRFRPRSHTVCYVNPQDPEDAVLDRDFTVHVPDILIPSLFMLIGIGGLAGAFRTKRV